MFKIGKERFIEEREATGETAEVYHRIRQTLRVTGVSQIFKAWAAADPAYFPRFWEAIEPTARALGFEELAESLRLSATQSAHHAGRPVADCGPLGESQIHQIRASLRLHSYLQPKILILAAAVRKTMERRTEDGFRPTGPDGASLPGIPASMIAMEAVSDPPEDARLARVFRDIRRVHGLRQLHGAYLTLGLWPDFLIPAWKKIRPLTRTEGYRRASLAIRSHATRLTEALPCQLRLEGAPKKFLRIAQEFESTLHLVILDIELIRMDIESPRDLAERHFTPEPREAA